MLVRRVTYLDDNRMRCARGTLLQPEPYKSAYERQSNYNYILDIIVLRGGDPELE
jgi:hypothetical protein